MFIRTYIFFCRSDIVTSFSSIINNYLEREITLQFYYYGTLLRRTFSNQKKKKTKFFSTLAFTASSIGKFCSIVSDSCNLHFTKQARRKIVLFTNLHKIFQERLICADTFVYRGISYAYVSIYP